MTGVQTCALPISNPNFFFEFLCFFVFSHFLVDFHCISLIFLSHISQKTQKLKVSSHLDSNTADSTSLITSSTLSYEMFTVHYWLLILKLENSSYLLIVDLYGWICALFWSNYLIWSFKLHFLWFLGDFFVFVYRFDFSGISRALGWLPITSAPFFLIKYEIQIII